MSDIIIPQDTVVDENIFYENLRSYIVTAQKKIYAAVNSAMVTAYWQIGRDIHIACVENDRAPYGKQLLKNASLKLTAEFGKGFDETNLRKMRQFYPLTLFLLYVTLHFFRIILPDYFLSSWVYS